LRDPLDIVPLLKRKAVRSVDLRHRSGVAHASDLSAQLIAYLAMLVAPFTFAR